jgi:hypothetical protein
MVILTMPKDLIVQNAVGKNKSYSHKWYLVA